MTFAFKLKYMYSLIVLCTSFLCAGGYFYHLHIYEIEKLRIQETHRLQQEAKRLEDIKAQKDAEFQKIVNRYLSDFTKELEAKMRNYKKNRKMVRELINPLNHETPEYSKDSYDHFTKVLMPYLREQSSHVINTFQHYKIALDTELVNESTERRERFQRQWDEMMKKQLDQYIAYFIKEDKVLAAYQDLIEFYYVHSKLIAIDFEEDAFLFKRKQDEIKHLEILARLKSIE